MTPHEVFVEAAVRITESSDYREKFFDIHYPALNTMARAQAHLGIRGCAYQEQSELTKESAEVAA